MKHTIQYRTLFGGWYEVNHDEALERAKEIYRSYNPFTDLEKDTILERINNKFTGVEFKHKDLYFLTDKRKV